MPKGHIEKSETCEQEAIREVREEIGLEELWLIACLGKQEFQYRDKQEIQHKKVVSWYLMETPYESHLSIKVEEGFVESKWLPYEDARKQCSYEDFREWIDKAADNLRNYRQHSALFEEYSLQSAIKRTDWDRDRKSHAIGVHRGTEESDYSTKMSNYQVQ